jgi:Cu(I)/Ag(I) efflux system membrane fusion protein
MVMTKYKFTDVAVVVAVMVIAISAALYVVDPSSNAELPMTMTGINNNPYRAGPFYFDLSLNPSTPRVGENSLSLVLNDAEGKPVANASIEAVAEMPAMGSMPAMRAPADITETGPGKYEGSFETYMDGSWPLTLKISAPGMPAQQVNFDLATGRAGIQLNSGASRTYGSDMMEDAPPGTVTLDSRRSQLIGVKKALAQRRTLTRTIRAVGKVDYDQTRISDITLKFDAWIGELYADSLGKSVSKGEPLFTVYSPELLSAQQEYLELKKRSGISSSLLSAARKRLLLWDMSTKEIAALEQRGSPFDYVTMRAPRTGVLVRKNIVRGSSHRAGMTLLRIADLSQVWVEADIYEGDLALIRAGMQASISLPNLNNDKRSTTISFIYPFVDAATRTARVRFELANPEGELKPDMYVEATLMAVLDERLVVPEEAVIISGQSRYVFEDIGKGRFAPRKVKTGVRADGYIEIIEGLNAGDCVITSGNFLIASESRLKAGIEQW